LIYLTNFPRLITKTITNFIEKMNKLKHVVCAVSGGVDSSVSAYLLKKQGFRVTGVFMKNWDRIDENDSNCSIDNDENDAEYVCKKLQIPFISVDFSKNYWNKVFRLIFAILSFNYLN
jgi:tRNA U34 2-thiouridine synthase MnmA/TrmU